jgi:hypothetical protein
MPPVPKRSQPAEGCAAGGVQNRTVLLIWSVGVIMSSHNCMFSIVRLLSNYKGSSYEINECEECGSLGLFAGSGVERRVILKGSAEFHDTVDMMDFLIRAVRN